MDDPPSIHVKMITKFNLPLDLFNIIYYYLLFFLYYTSLCIFAQEISHLLVL